MSRPFTYNDENFTVMGNILFVHYQLSASSTTSASTWREEKQVPQGIVDRLKNDHEHGSISLDPFLNDSSIACLTRIKNGIFGVYTYNKVTKGSVASAIYYLKDI